MGSKCTGEEELTVPRHPAAPLDNDAVLFKLGGQGTSFAYKEAMVLESGPHGSIAFLPRDRHPPRRYAFRHLHGPEKPPPVCAFASREIGPGLLHLTDCNLRRNA